MPVRPQAMSCVTTHEDLTIDEISPPEVDDTKKERDRWRVDLGDQCCSDSHNEANTRVRAEHSSTYLSYVVKTLLAKITQAVLVTKDILDGEQT